ncbi:MAG TPA: hypothetical protein VK599_07765, partial [Streptosporangiaceae bacterium]|nr:hypothetical protein [Streptosporangiaceae bacterium]
MHDVELDVHGLMSAASVLEAVLRQAPGEHAQAAAARLRDSVVRPLKEITGLPGGGDDPAAASSPPEPPGPSPEGDPQASGGESELPGRLRELALIATRLRV